MGIKLKKGTEAPDEASVQMWRRETNVLLLLYIHLVFFYACKISKMLLVNGKPASAAAGELLSRQVNFFAISSLQPERSDGRSVVSCFLFFVDLYDVDGHQTQNEVTFDFSTCLFLKCSLFFLNKKTQSFSLFLNGFGLLSVAFLSSYFRFFDDLWEFLCRCTEKQNKEEKNFISGTDCFWLVECESQQFLSFLCFDGQFLLLRQNWWWRNGRKERERFLNPWWFTPLFPSFFTSFISSSLPHFSVLFSNLMSTHRYLLTNRHAFSDGCFSAVFSLTWTVWKPITARKKRYRYMLKIEKEMQKKYWLWLMMVF